jgi:carotenoid cleavage dioxygenase-like enzyme
LIADARDLGAPPLARVRMPQRVPYGLHGLWLSRADLEHAR